MDGLEIEIVMEEDTRGEEVDVEEAEAEEDTIEVVMVVVVMVACLPPLVPTTDPVVPPSNKPLQEALTGWLHML